MTGFLSDVRFTLRTLARSPLFTAIAVLSLALGIGANTAIFTLLDQLMLRVLPVKDPQQLVQIISQGEHWGSGVGRNTLSYPMYQDLQKRAPAFSGVFCRYTTASTIAIDGAAERVQLELVSGNYFNALGVGPAAGRVFNVKGGVKLDHGGGEKVDQSTGIWGCALKDLRGRLECRPAPRVAGRV